MDSDCYRCDVANKVAPLWRRMVLMAQGLRHHACNTPTSGNGSFNHGARWTCECGVVWRWGTRMLEDDISGYWFPGGDEWIRIEPRFTDSEIDYLRGKP